MSRRWWIMGRHERRRAICEFRKVAKQELVTYLVAIDVDLTDHPVLNSARQRWLADRFARKPICIACRAQFADEGTVLRGES